MGEYNGRINVLKDSMLFVVNSVFNQGIKESTTKEEILKMMPDIYEWTFERLLKNNELGIDILGDLSNMCMFEEEIELKKFMDLFTDWYNNSPQYMLGGYSPIEFRETFK